MGPKGYDVSKEELVQQCADWRKLCQEQKERIEEAERLICEQHTRIEELEEWGKAAVELVLEYLHSPHTRRERAQSAQKVFKSACELGLRSRVKS